MASQGFVGAYFWGVYVWFVVGIVLIAVPAIGEIVRTIKAQKQ